MGLKTNPDCYDWIRRTYLVNPYVGQEVTHSRTGQKGVVVGKRGSQQYVYVDFTGIGRRYASPCHPEELGLQKDPNLRGVK